jgi:hypothetical protein
MVIEICYRGIQREIISSLSTHALSILARHADLRLTGYYLTLITDIANTFSSNRCKPLALAR